ncbi:hypothetical protein DAPPUDRAFT_311888 [Daphnia pulex]|uniref:Cuticular protein n=1 Tax=Daphnia pulex TaxID=6669 RepID=E9FY79_DAPPU|nr:hypothetical protein DAPPUDRAFT_311888 [Daphnia pulex]|eukprot:EFX87824.1 hypothetical protein DAPPUDRAFT_311888 [Daphnia pulex]
MNSFITLVLLSIAAVLLTQTAAAPPSYGKSYGAVPALPPFGVAAKHPRYGSGYGGYGGNYGNNDYVIALRYEDQVRDNSGIQTSYAYDVEGQKVQVARLDPVYYKKY